MYNLSIPLGSILFLRPNKIMSDKDLPDKINSTAATEFRQQGYLALMIKTSWDNFAIQAQIASLEAVSLPDLCSYAENGRSDIALLCSLERA